MTRTHIELQLLVVLIAVTCALPGVYLVLRRMSMMVDAISHVLFLGVAAAFVIVQDLRSPWLLIGAGVSGVLLAALVEILQRTRLVREDAAIGLVFPAMFALGVIVATMKFRNIHLDVDRVMLGTLEYAGLWRYDFLGPKGVPKALVHVVVVLAINIALIALFYKELKLSSFDPLLAASLGFAPGLLHYGLMTVVSLTAVTTFDAVGPILVVGLMIVPAAAAWLLTDRFSFMLWLSVGLAIGASICGYWVAFIGNFNIAGAMTSALGILFGIVFFFAPQRGLVAIWRRRSRQEREFLQTMLAIHLLNHEGTAEESEESRRSGLHEHLQWRPDQVNRVIRWAERGGLVEQRGEHLALTPAGRQRAQSLFGA